jgi:mannose-6-phosphate isomerase-like protein (cupin superfamily)
LAIKSTRKCASTSRKSSRFSDQFSPKIVGELNDFHVKLVKLKGPFVWHRHDVEDELFLVVNGALKIGIREDAKEREVLVKEGEFIVMPHGVEHCPSAEEETHILLLEPKSTLNTGNLEGERTVRELERI